jgi:hypothetical protein
MSIQHSEKLKEMCKRFSGGNLAYLAGPQRNTMCANEFPLSDCPSPESANPTHLEMDVKRTDSTLNCIKLKRTLEEAGKFK